MTQPKPAGSDGPRRTFKCRRASDSVTALLKTVFDAFTRKCEAKERENMQRRQNRFNVDRVAKATATTAERQLRAIMLFYPRLET